MLQDNIIEGLETMIKRGWFNRLCDSSDTTVSASTVFLIVVTIIGCILLLIPAVVLLVEIYYNHTIATDLTGMAAFTTSVVGLFATGGLTKAWVTWSTVKYGNLPSATDNSGDSTTTFEELKA